MNNEIKPTLASDLAEMMAGWNKIEAAAKAQFPNADKAELYQICKGAMSHALGSEANAGQREGGSGVKCEGCKYHVRDWRLCLHPLSQSSSFWVIKNSYSCRVEASHLQETTDHATALQETPAP